MHKVPAVQLVDPQKSPIQQGVLDNTGQGQEQAGSGDSLASLSS